MTGGAPRVRWTEARRRALALGVDAGHEVPLAVLEASDVLVGSPHDAARVLSAVARALERCAFPGDEPGRVVG